MILHTGNCAKCFSKFKHLYSTYSSWEDGCQGRLRFLSILLWKNLKILDQKYVMS